MRRRLVACTALGLGCVALLAPWLVRNAVFTGNPVSPFLQSWFYAPGAEYFAPLAIEQTIAFGRSVGMGRGLGAFLALPWNLTIESIPGRYSDSFGFQISPLHIVALLAGVVVVGLRRRVDLAFLLVFAGAFATIWFLSSQEARYLLPLAGILAVAGSWAFDDLMIGSRATQRALAGVLVAAVALCAITQLERLPNRAAAALATPVADAVRDPARAAAQALAAQLPAQAKLVLVGEPRSYLFRQFETISYQTLHGPPLLALIHAAPDAHALQCALEEQGATHLVVNANRILRRSMPTPVAGYGAREFDLDMDKVRRLVQESRIVYQANNVYAVEWATGDRCPRSAR
jgi:hypothetical protein